MNGVRRLLGLASRPSKTKTIGQSLADIAQRLERLEQVSYAIRADAEVLRRRSGMLLEARRAIALLENGFQLYVDPQDHGGAVNLLTLGQIENPEIKVLRRFLKPGAVMLDVGANYGYYSMVAAPHLRSGGRVIGFEPNPQLFDFYRNSIRLNGFGHIVEAHALGVSNTHGTVTFEVGADYPGGGRIPRPDDPHRPHHARCEVSVVRLDDYLAPDLVVDIAKIDVESHETEVLDGMRAVIARSPNIIILMEFIFAFFRDDIAARDFLRMIREELGLKVQRVTIDGALVPADFESLRDAACTLALSRGGLPTMPALTFYAAQLYPGEAGQLVGDTLVWKRLPGGDVSRTIAFGPYLHLQRGLYRIEIDADWEGDFLCRFQDNFGDCLMQTSLAKLSRSGILELTSDARSLEMVLESVAEGPARLELRKVEFWHA